MPNAHPLPRLADLPKVRAYRLYAYGHTEPAEAVRQAVEDYRRKHGEPGVCFYYTQVVKNVFVYIGEK